MPEHEASQIEGSIGSEGRAQTVPSHEQISGRMNGINDRQKRQFSALAGGHESQRLIKTPEAAFDLAAVRMPHGRGELTVDQPFDEIPSAAEDEYVSAGCGQILEEPSVEDSRAADLERATAPQHHVLAGHHAENAPIGRQARIREHLSAAGTRPGILRLETEDGDPRIMSRSAYGRRRSGGRGP